MAPLTKLLLLAMAVTLLLTYAHAATTCPRETCVSSGDYCDNDGCSVEGTTGCTRKCPVDQTCGGNSGYMTCRGSAAGFKCDDNLADDNCESSFADLLAYTCVEGTCRPIVANEGFDNDFCKTSDDCMNGVNCIDGRCSGIAKDMPSSSSDRCKVGLRRNSTGICVEKAKVGESCISTSVCAYSECVDGTCTAPYTLTEGADCSDAPSNGCALGLYCLSGQCTAVFESSMTPCNDTGAGCSNAEEECECNTGTGQMVCVAKNDVQDALCAEYPKKYFECLEKNGCHEDSSVQSTNSCAYHHCASLAKSYYGCTLDLANKLKDSSCKSPAAMLAPLMAMLF